MATLNIFIQGIWHRLSRATQEWLHSGPAGAKVDKCSIKNEKSIDKLTYISFERH